jgi:hypothetical protein
MTPSSSEEFAPELSAIEQELHRMSPSRPSNAFLEQIINSVSNNPDHSDIMLEHELHSMQPATVSASLLTDVEFTLGDHESQDLEQQESEPPNVVTMPQWRDFIPIFRVAAAIAICLGVLSMWTTPPAGPQKTANRTIPPTSGTPIPTLDGGFQRVSVDSALLEGGSVMQTEGYRAEELKIEDESLWKRPRKAY